MTNAVRIPEDRIAVLIGSDGKVRKRVEEFTGLELDIDSETGDVEVVGDPGDDPVLPLVTLDFVKAVGRGFNPDVAFRLFNDDVYLDVIDISNWVGKKKNHLERVKGRIIGSEGKTRRTLEEYTGARISIYGKTVAIIGDHVELQMAREAVEKLIDGAPHSAVYKWLDERLHEVRMDQLGL